MGETVKADRLTMQVAPGMMIGEQFGPTMTFRLAVSGTASTEPPRLQQAWRGIWKGEVIWKDIPIVVVPDLPPRSAPEPSP